MGAVASWSCAPRVTDPDVVANRCAPRSTTACACIDGRTGTQACLNDGTFGACQCGGDDAGTDALMSFDAPPSTDVPIETDVGFDSTDVRLDIVNDPSSSDARDASFTDAIDALEIVDVPSEDVAVDVGPPDAGPCGRVCPSGFSCVGTVCTDSARTAFSATSNPTGNWTYAWAATRTSTRSALDHGFVDTNGLQLWGRAGESTGTPGVVHNPSASDVTVTDTTWPAGVFAAHPGPSNEHVVVSWRAPEDGTYRVSLAFTGLTSTGTTTDVAVLRAGSELFSAELNYGGRGNVARFATPLALSAGEIIDAVVGFGAGGTYYSDTTGIDFVVTLDDRDACNVSTDGLAAYIPMDGSGADRTGNGHDATLMRSVTAASSAIRGGAYAFDGMTSAVCLGGSGSVTSDRTYCAWVNYPGRMGLGEPVITGGLTGAGDFLGIASAGQTDSCGGSPNGPFIDHWGYACDRSTTAFATPGAWSFVCVSYTGGTVTLYANGSSATVPGSFYTHAFSRFCIGANTIGGTTTFTSFAGAIDEVTLWTRALSSAELDALYAGGRGCVLE
jgi:hypothetical protein